MSFFQIEKNQSAVARIVITNIVKMLSARGLIRNESATIQKVLTTRSDDGVYPIQLDVLYGTSKQKIFMVKLIPHKITGINKSYGASDFLNTYKEHGKFLIVEDVGLKIAQQIIKGSPNTEIFKEEELMINLIDHEIVPTHRVLSEEEARDFYEKFNLTKKQMPRILNTEPVARYYNMQPGDICHITRPSSRAGSYSCYRLVTKGVHMG